MPRSFASWRLNQRRMSHQPASSVSDYEERREWAGREMSRLMSVKAKEEKKISPSSEKVSPKQKSLHAKNLSGDALAAREEAESVVNRTISPVKQVDVKEEEKVEEEPKLEHKKSLSKSDSKAMKNRDFPLKVAESTSKVLEQPRRKKSSTTSGDLARHQARYSRSDSLR